VASKNVRNSGNIIREGEKGVADVGEKGALAKRENLWSRERKVQGENETKERTEEA
jgi:hypothetical protein